MAAVDISSSAIPHNLEPRQLASELRFLTHAANLLDARISGLSAEALVLLERGTRLPFYHAVRGSGRERWAKPLDAVFALGDLMGVELRKPGVITPKQAITAGIPEKQVRKISETPVGALKLVEIDQRKVDKEFGV